MKFYLAGSFIIIGLAMIGVELQGSWKVDPKKRDGLDDFLIGFGYSFFKRTYTTATGWQNQWMDKQGGNEVGLNGFVGPLQRQLKMKVVTDNSTVTRTSFDDLGDIRSTATEFIGRKAARSYQHDPDNFRIIDFIVTRTIEPSNPDELIFTISHLPPSARTVTSYMYREC